MRRNRKTRTVCQQVQPHMVFRTKGLLVIALPAITDLPRTQVEQRR